MLLTVKTVYMKKTLFSCCVLIALLWGTTLELIAQPAQRLINVVVSPDHTDWKYKSKEEVTFTVQVFKDENLLENDRLRDRTGVFSGRKEIQCCIEKGEDHFEGVTEGTGLFTLQSVGQGGRTSIRGFGHGSC